MKVAIFACSLWACTFLLHWLMWRAGPPRRPFRMLLFVFLGVLPIALFAVRRVPALQPYVPVGGWEIAHAGLFHIALSLAYIVIYSALDNDSPTLAMICYLADAGERGRSRDDFLQLIGNESIIGLRFDSMIVGGLIMAEGDRYMLTSKGLFWAKFFDAFRCLFRLEKGG